MTTHILISRPSPWHGNDERNILFFFLLSKMKQNKISKTQLHLLHASKQTSTSDKTGLERSTSSDFPLPLMIKTQKSREQFMPNQHAAFHLRINKAFFTLYPCRVRIGDKDTK